MSVASIAPQRNGTESQFSGEQLDLIKRTVAKGVTDEELRLFLYSAATHGLDPLLKQVHAIKRWDNKESREVMSIQVGIDGYRLLADRTRLYAGNDEPEYGPKNEQGFPEWARVTVWKIVSGTRCPFTATARWSEYFPGDKQGFMWKRMPHLMLSKCAEALALRKAFPAELSGIYTAEEMDQAGPSSYVDAEVVEQPRKAIQPAAVVNETPKSAARVRLEELASEAKKKLPKEAREPLKAKAIASELPGNPMDCVDDAQCEAWSALILTALADNPVAF